MRNRTTTMTTTAKRSSSMTTSWIWLAILLVTYFLSSQQEHTLLVNAQNLIVGCPDGSPPIPSDALLSGRLINGGFGITVLNIVIPENPNQTPGSEVISINLFQNIANSIGVRGFSNGQTLNGAMLKIINDPNDDSITNGDTGTVSWTTNIAGTTTDTACAPPAVALQTTDNSDRLTVTGDLTFTSTAGVDVTGIPLEITIAVLEADGSTKYYNSAYRISFAVSGGITPTPPAPTPPGTIPTLPPLGVVTPAPLFTFDPIQFPTNPPNAGPPQPQPTVPAPQPTTPTAAPVPLPVPTAQPVPPPTSAPIPQPTPAPQPLTTFPVVVPTFAPVPDPTTPPTFAPVPDPTTTPPQPVPTIVPTDQPVMMQPTSGSSLINGCPQNSAAVPSDVVLSGRLVEGGFALTLLGQVVPETPGQTPNSEFINITMSQNIPAPIGVRGLQDGQTLNAVLFKVVYSGVGTMTWTPTDMTTTTDTACVLPAVGLVTTDNSPKVSASGDLLLSTMMMTPETIGGVPLDITLAVVGADGVTRYYFSTYTMNFLPSNGIVPTAAAPTPPGTVPTLPPLAPFTASPVISADPVTFNPISAPAPTLAPTPDSGSGGDPETCLYKFCLVANGGSECCSTSPVCRPLTFNSPNGQCRAAQREPKVKLAGGDDDSNSIIGGAGGRESRPGTTRARDRRRTLRGI